MTCFTMCLKPRVWNACGFSKPQKVHANFRWSKPDRTHAGHERMWAMGGSFNIYSVSQAGNHCEAVPANALLRGRQCVNGGAFRWCKW